MLDNLDLFMSQTPKDRFAREGEAARRNWKIFRNAFQRFFQIDGDQRAAAFAFYAFFSLLPLVLIFVTAGSLFFNRTHAAREIIAYVENYVPLDSAMKHSVFGIITGVVNSRSQVSVMALVLLFWIVLGMFGALIRAVNRAWQLPLQDWWHLPLKSVLLLAVLASALLLGLSLPVLTDIATHWILPDDSVTGWLFGLTSYLLPLLVLFYGLSLFYKLAPRRPTRFTEVWRAALVITLLVRLLGILFVVYLENFSRLNAIYGTLGGIMALLAWFYLSGDLVIFGACLCAARVEFARCPG